MDISFLLLSYYINILFTRCRNIYYFSLRIKNGLLFQLNRYLKLIFQNIFATFVINGVVRALSGGNCVRIKF